MMIHEVTTGGPRNKLPSAKAARVQRPRQDSGRGNKGSKARVGKYIKRGYEGGQTPIFKRFPKRGFQQRKLRTPVPHRQPVRPRRAIDDGATVDAAALIEKGLVPTSSSRSKFSATGRLQELTIIAGWFSKSPTRRSWMPAALPESQRRAFEFPKPKEIHPAPTVKEAKEDRRSRRR